MQHIWSCKCGEETPVEPSVFTAGAVHQCPRCEQVWGCVMNKYGHKVWIKITDDEAMFHRLDCKWVGEVE